MANTMFSLHVNGLDELLANAKRAGKNLEIKMVHQMVRAITDIQNDAKEVKAGRFKNQTGNLRRSILKQVRSAEYGRVYVSSDAPYGQGVEQGTRAHTITVKKARTLANKKLGVIYGRTVHHPGSKPYPFMQPAFEDNKDKIERQYEQLAEEVIRTMAE